MDPSLSLNDSVPDPNLSVEPTGGAIWVLVVLGVGIGVLWLVFCALQDQSIQLYNHLTRPHCRTTKESSVQDMEALD